MHMAMLEDIPVDPAAGFRITVTFSRCPKLKLPMATIHGDKITWHGKYIFAADKWHRHHKRARLSFQQEVHDWLMKEYELHIGRMVTC